MPAVFGPLSWIDNFKLKNCTPLMPGTILIQVVLRNRRRQISHVLHVATYIYHILDMKHLFSYDSMIANLENVHGRQLSDWNKKGERIERQLTKIETEWQEISFLENSSEDEITSHRQQLEVRNPIVVHINVFSFHFVLNYISSMLYSL